MNFKVEGDKIWLVYLDSCITVVRGDYSVLNKDKID